MATREDMRLVASEEPEPAGEAGGDYLAGEFVPGPNVVVLRVIGRGGHATVYEAEIPVLSKRVALKVLHPHLAADAEMAKRMVAEARTLAKLEHPNIVQVFNAGFTTDERARAFILMELLQGISGRRVLEKKQRLPLANALEVVIDLASGLEVAHRNGVIHLDLKPDNIFVHTATNRAVAKLYDFGIQRIYDPASPSSAAQAFEGTPPYAAPEQLRGEPVTPRTDLYAFGVLLFEFVAGRRPFHQDEERDHDEAMGRRQRLEGEDPAHGSWLIDAQLHKPAPRLSSLLLVPAALEQLVAKCLEKDPARRPEGSAELGKELRMILERLDSTFLSTSPTTTQELLLSAARDGAALGPGKIPGQAPPAPAIAPSAIASAEVDWRGGTVRMHAPSTPEPAVSAGPVREPSPATTPERRARFGSALDPATAGVATPAPRGEAGQPRQEIVALETLEGVLTRAPDASPPRSRTPLLIGGAILLLASVAILVLVRGAHHAPMEATASTADTSTKASTAEASAGASTPSAVKPLPPAAAPPETVAAPTPMTTTPSAPAAANETTPATAIAPTDSRRAFSRKTKPGSGKDVGIAPEVIDPSTSSLYTTLDVQEAKPVESAAPHAKPTAKPALPRKDQRGDPPLEKF